MNAWDRSCFFFSSRRRHTRSDRDWSSDVCSSDLHADIAADIDAVPARAARRGNDRRSAQERIAEIGRLRVKHRSDDRDTAKQPTQQDRKSTRLNSSHDQISYAVFCLKKKKKLQIPKTAKTNTQACSSTSLANRDLLVTIRSTYTSTLGSAQPVSTRATPVSSPSYMRHRRR